MKIRASFAILTALFLLNVTACSTAPTDADRSIAHEPASANFNCKPSARETANGKRWDCEALTISGRVKNFHIVRLSGDHREQAYAHGYLMAEELENGVLGHTIQFMRDYIRNGSALRSAAAGALFECYSNRLRRSVTKDTRESIDQMFLGYRDGMTKLARKPLYTMNDAEDAVLGIELANVLEGLGRRIQESGGNAADVVGSCVLRAPINVLLNIFDDIGNQPRKLGGCVGFSLPKALGPAGSVVHARNLDMDMVSSWNMYPTLFLVEPKGKFRFVGSSAAGMAFPGGIGGMNEKGIALSLHQMSTTDYRSEGSGLRIAPRVSQEILEEADSIDKAIEIMRRGNHIAAWTMYITDNERDESARIEFSATGLDVERFQGKGTAQSNHFMLPGTKGKAFTYNFNKNFESLSRLQTVEREIGKLKPGRRTRDDSLNWSIRQLSGHTELVRDGLGTYEAKRAFGRTAVKAYNVQSVVMLPGLRQYWTTIGERNPAAHSTFAGFEIDWNSLEARPIGMRRTTAYEGKEAWEGSLERYVAARQAYANPKGPDLELTLRELELAISLAGTSGITEFPYHFMRARVLHEQGTKLAGGARHEILLRALAEWEMLWAERAKLHPYGQALVAIYSAATSDELGGNPPLAGDDRQSRLAYARRQLSAMQGAGYTHFDLAAKIELLNEIERGGPQPGRKLPALDFVVVEQ